MNHAPNPHLWLSWLQALLIMTVTVWIYGPALNGLGNALQNQGHLAEAIAQYERALQINPNMATVHNGLGCALLTQGHKTEALTQFQEALRLDPHFTIARTNLAGFRPHQKRRR